MAEAVSEAASKAEEPEGVGLSAAQILSEIRNVPFQDRAVPAEAAGLSLELILCGWANEPWHEEMAAYAHETQKEMQHEKIIRGDVLKSAGARAARHRRAAGGRERDDPLRRLLHGRHGVRCD